MKGRHQGRELAVQFLYGWEMNPVPRDKLSEFLLDSNDGKENSAWFFAVMLLNGVLDNLEDIDKHITEHLKKWTLDRLAKVDLALLRVSAYELLYQKETPSPVVINESVLLSKEFSGGDAYRFINGVLESLVKGQEKGNEKKTRTVIIKRRS